MFKSKEEENKVNKEALNSNNIIGKGTTFTGNIETYGNIRIEGKVVGDVISKGKVAIGPSAIIEGKVMAQVADIEGVVDGTVEISDLLTLQPTSKVKGDIYANKLNVESGAKFDGQCKMGQKNMKIELDSERSSDVKKLKEAV